MKNQRARGIAKDGRPIFSETVEQIRVAQWLAANNLFFTHVPNEVPRMRGNRVAQIIWLKQQKEKGVRAGCPDFLIFTPPPNAPGFATALELKAIDGDAPTGAQDEFLGQLRRLDWEVNWCRGYDEAIAWLESLGYGQKRG